MMVKPFITYFVFLCVATPLFHYLGNVVQRRSLQPWFKQATSELKPSLVSATATGANDVSAVQDSSSPASFVDPRTHAHRDHGRPPLSDLIRDNETDIIGNVQFLLDFAIIGHAKTGTTILMNRLARHEEVQMKEHEVRSLKDKRPAEMVGYLYDLPSDKPYKRGYKAPRDVVLMSSLEALQTYWPTTRLIVGVRHPVKWFAAWYNFMLRRGHKLPPMEDMVGEKLPRDVLFHVNLAQLGKTNPMVDPKQLNLLEKHKKKRKEEFKALESPMTNKLFLYEVSQPFVANKTLVGLYYKDMTEFVGLSSPLPPFEYKTRKEKKVNVCDHKYSKVRAELVDIGKAASEWIGNYFIEHPDVTVSSPDSFKEILKTWRVDPCINPHQG